LGEKEAALESLEQWLGGNPCPTAHCPAVALELIADLMRVACEAGADPSAVAEVGLEAASLLGPFPGRNVRGPLREATRQWVDLVRAGSSVSKRIRRAVAYLHDHYTSPDLREEEVAREAGLCLSRFSQAFHDEMGVTYWEYLTNRRMEEAQHLLASTSLSLKEIAEKVGYRTQEAFCRAFKQAVKVPPGRYRRQVGGGSRLF
jgi:AraC-like DNA-binding protein